MEHILDKIGLAYFWGKIKASFAKKTDVPTKVSQLTNDTGFIVGDDVVFAGDDDGQGVIAEGGDVNVIETVKVNGTALTPDANKAVNVVVPTSLSGLASDTTHRVVTDAEKTTWSGKQDALVSGTNIKTINNQDLLGSGNITIQGGSGGGGDENVIESITFNGNAVPVDENKNAAITVTIPDVNDFVEKVTSTDNAIVRFDGTAGAIQDSNVIIDDSNNIILAKSIYLSTIGTSVTQATASRLYFGTVASPYVYITSNNQGVFGIYRASDNVGVACYPAQNFFSTGNIDLGRTQSLWKNLYLSGTIGNGTYALTLPNKSGTIAITDDIPSAVTESTVSGWGFTKNTGTYSKPSGGIPKTDLADAVQTSLGLADTALQGFTETDPTVPAWAKAANKPSYTAAEVGALPDTTTIPAAPGTLNTTATTAQSTSSSEALSGNVTLHKVAKTGTYNDLIGKPTIPTVPTNVSAFTNDAGYITSASVVTIYSGSTTPSSSLGNNGDIYIQTS